jgi:hypothetical protein
MKYIEATQDVQQAALAAQEAHAYAEAMKYASPSASILELKHAIMFAVIADSKLRNLLVETYNTPSTMLSGKYVMIPNHLEV